MEKSKKDKGIRGTVYPSGHRFIAQLPHSLGRRSRTFDTTDEAWDWLRIENAKAVLGITTAGPGQSALPLGDVMREWLKKHAIMKEGTRYACERRLERFVFNTTFDRLPIGDILPAHIADILLHAPANNTCRQLGNNLSVFFDWADDNRYTPHGNPYRRSSAKAILNRIHVEPRENVGAIWTPQQLVLFIEEEPDPIYRDYWIFVAATGARRGEAVGLRWPNINFERKWCRLATNVTVSSGKIHIESTPKNGRIRKAYLAPMICDMLAVRREEQEKFRAGAVEWSDEWEWVFDRRRGWDKSGAGRGVHLDPNGVTRRFNQRTERMGLPRLDGPHVLRSVFNKLGDQLDIKENVRGAALGHTPPTVTGRHYDRVSEAELRGLAERLAAALFPAKA